MLPIPYSDALALAQAQAAIAAVKAQASGLASLDANSLVVQNPANAVDTATASKIVKRDASGDIAVLSTATAGNNAIGKTEAGSLATTNAGTVFQARTGLYSIGTGGDYADVAAMIAAGKYRGRLVANVTEDSNITVDANGLYLELAGFTLTMGAYQIHQSTTTRIEIHGPGEVDYTAVNAGYPWIYTDTKETIVIVDGFTFDNNSGVKGSALAESSAIVTASNMVFDAPNVVGEVDYPTGLYLVNGCATNIEIVGGGSNTAYVISAWGGVISNIRHKGTFSTTAPTVAAYGGVINGLGGNVSIVALSYLSPLSNARNIRSILGASESGVYAFCTVASSVTLTGDYNVFDSCIFNALVTVSSGAVRNHFTNCQFIAGISISDQTMLTACRAGAAAGSGAATITVAAGTGTVLTGCLTDAAISDAGTDTVITGCAVY